MVNSAAAITMTIINVVLVELPELPDEALAVAAVVVAAARVMVVVLAVAVMAVIVTIGLVAVVVAVVTTAVVQSLASELVKEVAVACAFAVIAGVKPKQDPFG